MKRCIKLIVILTMTLFLYTGIYAEEVNLKGDWVGIIDGVYAYLSIKPEKAFELKSIFKSDGTSFFIEFHFKGTYTISGNQLSFIPGEFLFNGPVEGPVPKDDKETYTERFFYKYDKDAKTGAESITFFESESLNRPILTFDKTCFKNDIDICKVAGTATYDVNRDFDVEEPKVAVEAVEPAEGGSDEEISEDPFDWIRWELEGSWEFQPDNKSYVMVVFYERDINIVINEFKSVYDPASKTYSLEKNQTQLSGTYDLFASAECKAYIDGVGDFDESVCYEFKASVSIETSSNDDKELMKYFTGLYNVSYHYTRLVIQHSERPEFNILTRSYY